MIEPAANSEVELMTWESGSPILRIQRTLVLKDVFAQFRQGTTQQRIMDLLSSVLVQIRVKRPKHAMELLWYKTLHQMPAMMAYGRKSSSIVPPEGWFVPAGSKLRFTLDSFEEAIAERGELIFGLEMHQPDPDLELWG